MQREIHEGPGVEASYDEGVVCSNDIGADERWPHWGPAAVQEGIAAVISVQLYVKDDTMGALNMFHATRARHRIGQAQGILMERFQIPADAAFAVLQRLSQQGSTKLHLIADDIVRTGQLPPGADSAVQG